MRSLLVIAMFAAGACASPEDNPPAPPRETATQVIPSSQPTAPAQPQERPVIVGGYSPASATDAGVVAAQKLAVDEIYKRDPQRGIVETVSAEQQVVAGMNYRLTIKMTGVNRYRVVVYKPLQGEMQVTSFEKLTS